MKIWSKPNGITLVSQVITIIILLILAGISIQALTNTGLFEGARQAKKKARRAQVEEYLSLKLLETQATTGTSKTSDEIIKITRKNVYDTRDELKKIGKDVIVEEVSTEEDGETVDTYFYVQVDDDVFKIDINGPQFIVEAGKFPPIIKIESITGTTNSITVLVTTKRNEGGKIDFYIKQEEDSNYPKQPVATITEIETSYTYTGLEQNKKYNIKIVATAENKQTAEVLVDETLGNVSDLEKADITFTYTVAGQEINKQIWTNKRVTVTASTEITGYTLYTSKDGKTWYDVRNQTFTENGQIYVVLYDGKNYGGSASANVTNIDTTAPKISTALSSTAQGIDSISLSVGITDANSGLGKVEWYYGATDNPTTLAGTTNVTDLNGSTAGPTTEQTITNTISGLSIGTTYYFKVIAYDVAGKTTASTVISASTLNSVAEAISYTPSDTSWNVDNVKGAVDSLYSR